MVTDLLGDRLPSNTSSVDPFVNGLPHSLLKAFVPFSKLNEYCIIVAVDRIAARS